MKIGIDTRCLERGRRTGVEEYTLNLLKNVFDLDKKNEYILFFNAWKKLGINLEWTEKYANVSHKILHYPNKFFNLTLWYFNWPKIDKLIGGADVFFMPNINFSAFSKETKLIATIHDLSFEHLPENFSWKSRLWNFLINPKKLCQRAQKIIAVSASTRNDLELFYKIDPQKITMTHSAVSDDFKVMNRNDPKMLEVKEKYNLPYHFILYLGAIEPRKNILSIVKAYNQLRRLKNQELDKYKLVIAGARGWKENGTMKEIEKSPWKDDIFNIGFIEPENKPYLYNLASLFVYPSFFEGFGFPPLEAMKSGVPVITSNNSSLPEIVGDAGILIDPEKPDEIYRAMREILLNKNLREKLREKGLNQAQKFSWRKTAEEFLEVVNSFKRLT
jgi:glycosyltransferase involved in cell wall biosynthesis